ncbi:MAG TPA: NUDIX domain-containing protein [Caulobacterales bacterium]|nr:NUDIX domain-containing protein [Caulobacterales bacterium]
MSMRRRLEPAITPLFRAYWRMRRPMTLGVRALTTDAEGRVLLVRHTYTDGWYFPGGGVESRETALDAVQRELMEEGGVEATEAPKLIGFYANHAKFPNDHIALYRVERWRTCAARSAGEIAEHGFFARDALPDGVTAGTLRRLAEVFDGAEISADW